MLEPCGTQSACQPPCGPASAFVGFLGSAERRRHAYQALSCLLKAHAAEQGVGSPCGLPQVCRLPAPSAAAAAAAGTAVAGRCGPHWLLCGGAQAGGGCRPGGCRQPHAGECCVLEPAQCAQTCFALASYPASLLPVCKRDFLAHMVQIHKSMRHVDGPGLGHLSPSSRCSAASCAVRQCTPSRCAGKARCLSALSLPSAQISSSWPAACQSPCGQHDWLPPAVQTLLSSPAAPAFPNSLARAAMS